MEVVDLYIGIGFDWIDWIDGRFLGNLLWRCCWSFRGWVWVGLVGVGIGGKEKRLSFGTYPDVSLKVAREKRDEAKRLLADNIDPSVQRKEQKRQTLASIEHDFESVAREWLSHMGEEWTPKHLAKTTGVLEKDAFPILGKYPVNEIKPRQILDTIRAMEERVQHKNSMTGTTSLSLKMACRFIKR